jgi:hypothetical protein
VKVEVAFEIILKFAHNFFKELSDFDSGFFRSSGVQWEKVKISREPDSCGNDLLLSLFCQIIGDVLDIEICDVLVLLDFKPSVVSLNNRVEEVCELDVGLMVSSMASSERFRIEGPCVD